MITVYLTIVALGLLIYIYRIRSRKMRLFKDVDVPGPSPNIIFGNLIEVNRKGLGNCLPQWSQIYGRIYGYFEGCDPVLVTSDVNLLKRICVKDFNHFNKRKTYPLAPHSDKDEFVHLFLANGARWKRLRGLLSPTFSSGKLKSMFPTINDCIDTCLQHIDGQSGNHREEIDIYKYLQPLTLDIIGRTAFAMKISCPTPENNQFLYHCKKIFDRVNPNKKRPLAFVLIFTFATLFPELETVWRLLNELNKKLNPKEGFQWILDKAGEIIEYRKSSSKPSSDDFIQLMLDAVVDDTQIPDYLMEMNNKNYNADVDINQNMKSIDGTKRVTAKTSVMGTRKVLTLSEMKANSGLFLLAGYESIAATTAYILYELALNNAHQNRVYSEIKTNISDIDDMGHDQITQLKYLEMVIFETMRLHPGSVTAVSRRSCTDFSIDGKTIPNGTLITADVSTIHRDTIHWGPEDTDLFVPERFSPERKAKRHPLAFLGFGSGPRNCIGMRFALLEIKVILSRFLWKYEVKTCAKTEVPLPKVEMTATVPKNGVYVKLIER